MTPDRWSDLEARAEKVADPPWFASMGVGGPLHVTTAGGLNATGIATCFGADDAAYIVALVNAAPDLIREARRCAALTEERLAMALRTTRKPVWRGHPDSAPATLWTEYARAILAALESSDAD